MKKVYFTIVTILVFIIFSISYFIYWFKKESGPVSTTAEKVNFVVEKGRSAKEVGEQLFIKNLIRNKTVFDLYVRVLNKTKNLNAGEFELSPSMSVPEIVNTLGKGPKELWVTIPEGLRKEEIVEKIIQAMEMDEEKAKTFRSEFLILADSSEGYLFPDTYLFPRDTPSKIVYEKLKSTFNEKFNSLVEPLSKQSKYLKSEIVVMASILERETKSREEKPIVAGILWKRIENDWPLQVDATVQYAISSIKCLSEPEALKSQRQVSSVKCDWWPVLTLDNLDIDSPYNTYKYKGLPSAPISNPGLASLQASASPQSSDYWYYIHSPNGMIHYAKTSAEHSANVRKYLNK